MDGTSELRISGYHALLVLRCVSHIGLWRFSLFLRRLFFKKRDSFPVMCSIFCSANVTLGLAGNVLAYSPGMNQGIFTGISGQVLWTAIIITYIRKSRRVARTFVITYAEQKGLVNVAGDLEENEDEHSYTGEHAGTYEHVIVSKTSDTHENQPDLAQQGTTHQSEQVEEDLAFRKSEETSDR